MIDIALIQLFDFMKAEIAKGGDWKERVLNSAKYKILDMQYDNLSDLFEKAESFMKGAESINYFIDKEIEYMVKSRKRMTGGMKVPFFDDLEKETDRIKRILTYRNIKNYDINSDYIDNLIKTKLLMEGEKNGFTFRNQAVLQRLRKDDSGV